MIAFLESMDRQSHQIDVLAMFLRINPDRA